MNGRTVLSGGLEFINLADVFQILGGNNSTGVLQLKSPHSSAKGLIYFVNGNPVNASNDTTQGIEAAHALFGWTQGQFEFCEEKVQTRHVIKKSRMEIVLDALRMLDEGVIKPLGAPLTEEASTQRGNASADDGKGQPPIIRGPLVDYSCIVSEENYPDGHKIVTQGGFGKWLWIILEGAVCVSRDTPKGPKTICRLGEGCFVGTFTSFTFREHARSATVTALGDVHLGLLDTGRLHAEYSSLSPEFKRLLLSLAGRLRKITDRAMDPPSNGAARAKEIRKQKLILGQGSLNEDLFSIVEGTAHVVSQLPQADLPLLTLERDDVFGHLPFLDMGHEPYSASIRASKDLRTDKLDALGIQHEYENLSRGFRNLIDNMSTCIAVTTKEACRTCNGSKVR
jgi:CRP-like cAMP-binding protein